MIEVPVTGWGTALLLGPLQILVLALVAGTLLPALGSRLFITDNAVHKHVGTIFAKLCLSPADSGHRRVLAVLTFWTAGRSRRHRAHLDGQGSAGSTRRVVPAAGGRVIASA
jgi:hypothetical protein